MKLFLPLLIVSLLANLVLGTLIASRSATPASVISNAPTEISPPTKNAATPWPKREPLWAGLKSDSLDEAVARLRAAGCPPKDIAAAVRAMLVARLVEQRSTLGYANETLPYWKSSQNFAQPRSQQEFMGMFLENQRLQRTYLLSPELFSADEESVRQYRSRFGDLDIEKLRQLAIVESKQQEKSIQGMGANSSSKPGEDRYSANPAQQWQQEAKQREDALKAILTPEEYAAYELRNSPTAEGLRSRLDSFQPSEAEYKALFELQKSAEATFRNSPPTPEQAATFQADYDAKLKATLGEERAADYQALQKAGSDLLPRLLNRLDIPLVSLTAINAIRTQTNDRAKAIRANPQLTAEQRTAQLSALAAEAETNLGSIFNTPRSMAAYKDLKGEWLRNLAPKPGGP
ncbi:hypothetical protein [Oleiharenicola lentus]|uniref:hypothetical protein n=1 Tax=Oleiharenicola lentus TaxID=2508720 RepID=UPI003F66335B